MSISLVNALIFLIIEFELFNVNQIIWTIRAITFQRYSMGKISSYDEKAIFVYSSKYFYVH